MFDEHCVLPFVIRLPLYRAYGLLRLDTHVVVMEFQVVDRFLGVLRSGIRTLHLPYLSLSNAEFQKNWMGQGTLTIRSSSLHPFKRVPGSLQGSCSLDVQRIHRNQAEIFANALLLKLSESQLERLNQAFDEPTPALTQGWNSHFKRLLKGPIRSQAMDR